MEENLVMFLRPKMPGNEDHQLQALPLSSFSRLVGPKKAIINTRVRMNETGSLPLFHPSLDEHSARFLTEHESKERRPHSLSPRFPKMTMLSIRVHIFITLFREMTNVETNG